MPQQQTTHDKVREIKQSFRFYMNGVTAQSLREKGADYKISWGISQQHLQEMAAEYEPNYELAAELWKSEVRECRLLATMLMPPAQFPPDLLAVWVERVHTQELAEMLSFNLLQHLDYAPDIAYMFMASPEPMRQLMAFSILSRLFSKGIVPDADAINEFIDQALTALQSATPSVRHAAMNCIIRFANLGDNFELTARNALRANGYDFL